MRGHVVLLASLLLFPLSSRGDDRILDWVKVTDRAGWQPRDSSGEVVYKDQLWILGGWFDSFAAPPRDVWSSPDGKTWKLVTTEAPWKHSDLPMTVVFNDRMWIMGGWYNGRLPGHGASNEVWSSTDGVTWEQATKQAGWSPRLAAGAVVFKGRMWILGGTENYYFGDDKSLKNDVWSSADGKEWRQETANAPWSPRAYHAAVVHDGKIWVFGGGNYVPRYQALNDVWCSSDGVHWEQVTEHAAVDPADLVLRGRLSRPHVGPGRLVEQPLEELGRRLVLPGRQDSGQRSSRTSSGRNATSTPPTSSRTRSGWRADTPSRSAARSGRSRSRATGSTSDMRRRPRGVPRPVLLTTFGKGLAPGRLGLDITASRGYAIDHCRFFHLRPSRPTGQASHAIFPPDRLRRDLCNGRDTGLGRHG